MGNNSITSLQMGALVILFELGSAMVVGIGMEAKQDAWLALLVGMAAGMLLFWMIGSVHSSFPQLTFVEIVELQLGKAVGKLLSFIYCSYFMYIAGRVLRDFSELVVSSFISGMTIKMSAFVLLVAVAFTLYSGVQAMARSAEIFGITVLLLWLIFVLLIVVSNIFRIEHLLPVLENGWMPVLKAAFPGTLTFPFGEMIVFFMLFKFIVPGGNAIRIGLIAMLISGCILAATSILNVGVNGVFLSQQSNFPILESISKIKIMTFISRVDPIALGLLVLGGFFKVTIFSYGAVSGLSQVFGLKKEKYLIVPILLIIYALSVFMARNIVEHLYVGIKIVPKFAHIPLQIIVPLAVAAFILIKKKIQALTRKP